MTQQQADDLSRKLAERFGGQAEAEEVIPGKFRFALVSPAFTGVPHMERQDRVWELVDGLIDRETRLELTLILAFAPDETSWEFAQS